MATFRMALSVPNLAAANAAKEQKTPTNPRKSDVLTNIADLMVGVAGGARRSRLSGQAEPYFTLSVDDNAVAATGTLALSGGMANNDTVTVGSITFTGKTSSPSGSTQFLCGVSATADAVALAAAINAHSTTNLYVLASAATGTVTLTTIGNAIGLLGNGIILSKVSTAVTVTAFASGAEDTGKQTYSF